MSLNGNIVDQSQDVHEILQDDIVGETELNYSGRTIALRKYNKYTLNLISFDKNGKGKKVK